MRDQHDIQTRTDTRKHRPDLWIALVLAAFSLGITFWWLAIHVRTTFDDGFYYLKIAQNIALGNGSTFDGIHPTNGYQPLWLVCLVPLFWISADPASAQNLATLLQGALFAASVVLLYSALRLRAGRSAASLGALLWIMLQNYQALGGMEFSLHALGVFAIAYVYLRYFADHHPVAARAYFALGLLSTLTILARLDTILLAFGIGLFLAHDHWRRGLDRARVAYLIAFALPILAGASAYAGLNWLYFGHPFPVSGLVKQMWSNALLSQDSVYLKWGWLAAKLHLLVWGPRYLAASHEISQVLFALAFAIGAFGAPLLWIAGLAKRGPARLVEWLDRMTGRLGPLVLYSALSCLSYVVLYHGYLSFSRWYFVIQIWLALMLFSNVFDQTFRMARSWIEQRNSRLRRLVEIVAVGVWLSVPVYTIRGLWLASIWEYPPIDLQMAAAHWISTNVPAGATIGAWNAGVLGYYSDHRVINLDGLVNSWDYFQRQQYQLCAYWQKNDITYIADWFRDQEPLAPIPFYPHYASCASRLELVWSQRIPGNTWGVDVYHILPP